MGFVCAGFFPDYLRRLVSVLGAHYGRGVSVHYMYYTSGAACLRSVLIGETDMTDIYFLQSMPDDDSLLHFSLSGGAPKQLPAPEAASEGTGGPPGGPPDAPQASPQDPQGAPQGPGGASGGPPSPGGAPGGPLSQGGAPGPVGGPKRGLMGAYFYRTCPVVGASNVFVTRSSLNFKSLKEVAAYIRRHPGSNTVAFLTAANYRTVAFLLPANTPFVVMPSESSPRARRP